MFWPRQKVSRAQTPIDPIRATTSADAPTIRGISGISQVLNFAFNTAEYESSPVGGHLFVTRVSDKSVRSQT